MHSFHGTNYNFHYNGDYSGEVIIQDKITGEQIRVESEDIFEFVAGYVRSKRISEIEDMEWKDLLK